MPKQEAKKPISLGVFLLLALGIVIVWASSPFVIVYVAKGYGGRDFEAYGQVGDIFGAVNSLFAGLAIAGLLYNIHLQRVEIHNTEIEVTVQRETTMLMGMLTMLPTLIQRERDNIRHEYDKSALLDPIESYPGIYSSAKLKTILNDFLTKPDYPKTLKQKESVSFYFNQMISYTEAYEFAGRRWAELAQSHMNLSELPSAVKNLSK